MKFLPLIFFSFFLFSFLAIAEYKELNQGDNYAGPTRFDNAIIDDVGNTRSVTDPRYAPFIADFDNDGENEILIISDTEIEMFTINMVKIDSLDISTEIYRPSPPAVVDIDGDGTKEIVLVDENYDQDVGQDFEVYSYHFNGTIISLQNRSWDSGSTDAVKRAVIECDTTPFYCVIIYAALPGAYTVNGHVINNSQIGTKFVIHNDVGLTEGFCLPLNPSMVISDWDGDSNDEIIMSFYHIDEVGDESLLIESYNVQYYNLTMTDQHQMSQNVGDNYGPASVNCDIYQELVSSPYVADIDGNPVNGLEVVAAIEDDVGEFRMESFDNDGDSFDIGYPLLSNIEMDWTSNIFVMDVLAITGREEFCIIGGSASDNRLRGICASEQTNWYDSETLKFGSEDTINYTITTDRNGPLANQAMSATRGGIDHIFTAYGSYSLDIDGTLALLVNEYRLDALGAAPTDGAIVLEDSENSGFADIYYLTETNLWHFDDGYENQGCEDISCVTSISYNPCRANTWKLNTSVEVHVRVVDSDGDDVSARVILYYGRADAQNSGWSENVTSGTTIGPFSFIANSTVNLGTIRIIARDTNNTDQNEIIDKSFSVQNNGVVFGDVTCTEDETTIAAINETSRADDSVDDNAIDNTITTLRDQTGLGSTTIFLLIMIMLTAAIWYLGYETPKYALAATVFLNLLVLMLGVRLGYIGFGTLLIFIILFVAVAAVAVTRFFTGGNG